MSITTTVGQGHAFIDHPQAVEPLLGCNHFQHFTLPAFIYSAVHAPSNEMLIKLLGASLLQKIAVQPVNMLPSAGNAAAASNSNILNTLPHNRHLRTYDVLNTLLHNSNVLYTMYYIQCSCQVGNNAAK